MIRKLIKEIFKAFGMAVFFYKKNYHYIPDHFCKSSARKMNFIGNSIFSRCANKVIRDKKCSLYYDRLFTFYQLIKNIKNLFPIEHKITVLEAGVYKGGSSYFISSLLKQMLPQNQIELFSVDTFEGHSELDIKHQREGLQTPGLFSNTSYESVKKYLSDFDFVTVLKGRIQGFEKKFSKKDFTLIHLDMDLYEPTIYALNHYSENLVINGFFVIDDYKFESCPGIEKAIIDFLANHSDFIKIELITGQCILIKTRVLNTRAKNPGTGSHVRKTAGSKERVIENLKTF